MRLYRPCGLVELGLVFDAALKAWPPRLPEQPIFYPVTNREYAEQISRSWNTTEGDRLGYVTGFEVDDRYVAQFERQIVGAKQHEELWVPAEALPQFNAHIDGQIEVLGLFAGAGARGFVPEHGPLKGLGWREQLELLLTKAYVPAQTQLKAMWLNWPLLRAQADTSQLGAVLRLFEVAGIAAPEAVATFV